ncbi:50S ribosomal protein L13P [mine drainage metagenome]|uniref:50S ribosomal protein L13P n=1 Tax=mine drainage metagenome TaxID=410659 RepID=T1DGW8_9ZZZZ
MGDYLQKLAKELLNGEEIVIVNSAQVVVTGGRDAVLKRFRSRRDIGSVRKGPHYPRTPNAILRRSIGQMLPKKTTRGQEALSRCRVYNFEPKTLKDVKKERVEGADNTRMSGFVTLQDISKYLGLEVKQ